MAIEVSVNADQRRAAQPQRVLVTGAAGFIGSALARALIARGDHVIGIDNFDPFYQRSVKEDNLGSIRDSARDAGAAANFDFIQADIADADTTREMTAWSRPHTVVHLAARAGVRPSIEDPIGYAHANVTGLQSALSAATAAGARRFVFGSSSSVYGNNPHSPFSETHPVDEPISPYAATKRAGELMCHTHASLTGMPTAALRFFTVFGPGQRPDLAIHKFMRRIARGEPIAMFGDGSTSRDYTFIDDIVAGIVAAIDGVDGVTSAMTGPPMRVWNLGGSNPVTLRDMIASVGRAVGREPIVERAPMQAGDVQRTCADVTRSGAELGYAPRTSFETGLAKQWAWLEPRLAAEPAPAR